MWNGEEDGKKTKKKEHKNFKNQQGHEGRKIEVLEKNKKV